MDNGGSGLGRLVGIYAKKLLAGELLQLLELATKSTGKRVAADTPELGDTDACRVGLHGCSHRGEYGGGTVTCHKEQGRLVFQRVDGIDDVVILLQLELTGGICGETLMESLDV